ncbi:MAG TPA: hypothetical protein EYP53_10535 [Candidatus Latescibacteria bacterium]|nr:hypothetical protein [Candidatus Latescibacterota bacterium]
MFSIGISYGMDVKAGFFWYWGFGFDWKLRIKVVRLGLVSKVQNLLTFGVGFYILGVWFGV